MSAAGNIYRKAADIIEAVQGGSVKLISHKTYRCVFCGLRMPGSKMVEHAKTHSARQKRGRRKAR